MNDKTNNEAATLAEQCKLMGVNAKHLAACSDGLVSKRTWYRVLERPEAPRTPVVNLFIKDFIVALRWADAYTSRLLHHDPVAAINEALVQSQSGAAP